MSDVECPYCGHAQEIVHDDGYACAEGDGYEQECWDCEKVFTFSVMIRYHYTYINKKESQ